MVVDRKRATVATGKPQMVKPHTVTESTTVNLASFCIIDKENGVPVLLVHHRATPNILPDYLSIRFYLFVERQRGAKTSRQN